jgi:hypothetical protein
MNASSKNSSGSSERNFISLSPDSINQRVQVLETPLSR